MLGLNWMYISQVSFEHIPLNSTFYIVLMQQNYIEM